MVCKFVFCLDNSLAIHCKTIAIIIAAAVPGLIKKRPCSESMILSFAVILSPVKKLILV